MSQQRANEQDEKGLMGVEVVRTPAGFNHSHVAEDFYFTPLRAGDRLMPNYHLSYASITAPQRVPRLKDVVAPAVILQATMAGADLDEVCEAGLLFTPKAGENPFLHRSPAAQYALLLKEGYATVPSEPESGQRIFTVECVFKPGQEVFVKQQGQREELTGVEEPPILVRQRMTVASVKEGRVAVYWADERRVMQDATFLPSELEHAPAEESAAAPQEETGGDV